MPAVNRTQLTPEQMARFGKPTDELLDEHWTEIPETFTPPTAEASTWDGAAKGFFEFFEGAGNSLWGAITGFGTNIKDTLVSLIFLAVLLLVVNFLVRGAFRKWSSRRKTNDSEFYHHSCHHMNDMAGYQQKSEHMNSCRGSCNTMTKETRK